MTISLKSTEFPEGLCWQVLDRRDEKVLKPQ